MSRLKFPFLPRYSKALLFVFLMLCSFKPVFGHPEDEFCRGDGLDPLLCAQLSALDSPDYKYGKTTLPVVIERTGWKTFSLYVRLGVEHILPFGADHLIFILALIFACTRFASLAFYISLFTLAHSITLILNTFNLVLFPSALVESLIALSIVVVGVENLVLKRHHSWRFIVVFLFGLLHGLGFAGALREIGMPEDALWVSLLGFNLGVELAQLGFAACVFLLLMPFAKKHRYRTFVVVPGSVLIALVGGVWFVERAFL